MDHVKIEKVRSFRDMLSVINSLNRIQILSEAKAAGTSFGKLGAFEIDANLDAAIGGTPELLHDRPAGWGHRRQWADIPWGNALEILLISVRRAGWRAGFSCNALILLARSRGIERLFSP